MKTIKTVLLLFVMLSALILAGSAYGVTTSYSTNFDSMAPGSINGKEGWSATNPSVDQSVVSVGAGNNVFRMSNAYGSGSFSDYPYGPGIAPAGELASYNNFQMSLSFQSATGAAQAGLFLGVGPSTTTDLSLRQGTFFIYDNSGAGLNVLWQDYVGGTFVNHLVASNLSYTGAHTLAASLTFLSGPGNDTAQISVDGNVAQTFTDYEGLYGTPVSSNTVLFKSFSGFTAPSLAGAGLYFDNLSYSVSSVPEPSTWIEGALVVLLVSGSVVRRWQFLRPRLLA